MKIVHYFLVWIVSLGFNIYSQPTKTLFFCCSVQNFCSNIGYENMTTCMAGCRDFDKCSARSVPINIAPLVGSTLPTALGVPMYPQISDIGALAGAPVTTASVFTPTYPQTAIVGSPITSVPTTNLLRGNAIAGGLLPFGAQALDVGVQPMIVAGNPTIPGTVAGTTLATPGSGGMGGYSGAVAGIT